MEESERLTEWENSILQGANLQKKALTQVRCFAQVDSTMDIARALLPTLSVADRVLVVAKEQTKGRGRHGRVWTPPKSGFYGTYAFASNSSVASISGFSLVVGIAVARLARNLGAAVRLKWPNDVMSEDGAKLAGILIEIVTEQRVPWVLTGIGINLSGEPQVDARTCSLETLTGMNVDAVGVATQLSPVLVELWQEFAQGGFAAFRQEWTMQAYGFGERMTVDTGNSQVTGIFNGVTDRGGLILECKSGLMEIVSGHVVTSPQA